MATPDETREWLTLMALTLDEWIEEGAQLLADGVITQEELEEARVLSASMQDVMARLVRGDRTAQADLKQVCLAAVAFLVKYAMDS